MAKRLSKKFFVIILVLLLLSCALIAYIINIYQPKTDHIFNYNGKRVEGWVNCMPPLSATEEYDLCKWAEEVHYPQIAY